MNKLNVLIFAVIALLIINIGTLSFLFLNQNSHAPYKSKHPRHHKHQPNHLIIERLNLDSAQQVEYQSLIDKHRSSIHKVESSIRKTKAEFYELLNQENTDKKDSLIAELSDLHTQIEQVHFQHFKALKAICTPDQMNDFERLSKDLAKIFGRHHRRRPKHSR